MTQMAGDSGESTDITQWLSTKNAAVFLGLSQQYVIKLAQNGTLRCVRTQLGLLIDPAALDAYGRERRGKHTSGGGAASAGGYANPKKSPIW